MNYPIEDLRFAIETDRKLSESEKFALIEYLEDYDFRSRYPQEICHGGEIPCEKISEEEAMIRHLQERVVNFEAAHPDLSLAIQKAAAVLGNIGI